MGRLSFDKLTVSPLAAMLLFTLAGHAAVQLPNATEKENTTSRLTPSFWGDWEAGTVTGKGNRNWQKKQVVADDRIRILSDGGARQGSRYVRVEVRSGDNPGSSVGTERAEVLHAQNADGSLLYENMNSGTQQYAFSVKFDPSWQQPSRWGIFLQLHGPDVYRTNPAWALSATDKIRLNMRVGDLTTSRRVSNELSNGELNIGKWIDFVLTVKYARDNTGSITLLRRDEGENHFTPVLSVTDTPTLQYSSTVDNGAVGNHYLKHGFYRSADSFTSILYLDGFTRTRVP